MASTAKTIKDSRAVIGIDIGGTKVLAGLFDEKFKVIEDIKFKTQAEKGEAYFKKHLDASVKDLRARAKKDDYTLVGIGVGCAGFIDRQNGVVKSSPNITFLKNYPLSRHLSSLAKVPVVLGNDVQFGIYGEHRLGAAQGLRHVIGIFFGTGIGGALILNGHLYDGASGCAGDIGHYLVSPMTSLAGSERDSVLDSIASRAAIAGEAATLVAKHSAPHLMVLAGADVNKIRGSTLAESIKKGDKRVEAMVRSRARTAGIALSNIVDFLNPEMVVLGGGLVEALPAIFLKEVEAGIREHSTPQAQKALQVVISKLGDHAVTTGAAKMAWEHCTGDTQSRKDER